MRTDRTTAIEIGRAARRLLVKAGGGIRRVEATAEGLPEATAVELLVHEDGLLRVPVLILGDLVVRGFTEPLYQEAVSLIR